MKIGSLQRVSLIDYPGLISAVVFLQGCNFRCSYCHNPELVDPALFKASMKESDVMEFLDSRKGKLDAVAITGGEPTIQDGLADFIREIKKKNYAVKIDTNGSQPQIINALLQEKLIDYIAMDIKAPLDKYKDIVKVAVNQDAIKESVRIILKAQIPYEFRTTIVASQLDENDILQIGRMINGASRYVLQMFVPSKTLDNRFLKEKSFPYEKLEKIKGRLEKQILSVFIR